MFEHCKQNERDEAKRIEREEMLSIIYNQNKFYVAVYAAAPYDLYKYPIQTNSKFYPIKTNSKFQGKRLNHLDHSEQLRQFTQSSCQVSTEAMLENFAVFSAATKRTT